MDTGSSSPARRKGRRTAPITNLIISMKKRPDGFLSSEAIDQDSEQFDYIRELHDYLWRFVRVHVPSANGNLKNYVDKALEIAEKGNNSPTPMNREKLEAEIFNIINSSCEHKNTPLEDSCGFCRIYQRRTKDILTAIDAYEAEREKELKTKTNIAFIEITKAIGTSTQFMKKDGRRKVMQVIREFNRANIHPSATHGKEGEV